MSMVSVPASELEFYQQKILRLQMQVIQLQQELIEVKTRPPNEQYQIKYELLLAKIAAEDTAQQEQHTRSMKELENQLKNAHHQWEQKLQETNRQWQLKLQEKTSEWAMESRRASQQKEGNLDKTAELERKISELQSKLDEGDGQVLRAQLKKAKEENQSLLKEQREAYAECQLRLERMQKDNEIQLQNCKEREKGYYRDEINELRSKTAELEEQVQFWKGKVSPEGEKELSDAREELKRMKEEQAAEIGRLAAVLQKRNRQHEQYRAEVDKKSKVHLTNMQDLNSQLHQYQQNSYNYKRERDLEMKNLQRQMTKKREQEFQDLREQVKLMEREFEKDKENMRRIEHQSQVEVARIQREWETAKEKYLEQKTRLKEKNSELKQRLKELEQKGNEQLLAALQQASSSDDNQFGNYDNAITFMDRQVKKTSHKVQQKDREISRLLEQMRNLQQETDREIAYVKDKARKEQTDLLNKVYRLQSELDMTTHALRLKEKNLNKRDNELAAEKEGKTVEVAHLRQIIQEMERDFDRMIGRKKSLQDSYREERENVITGKVDINQEKKKKWYQLQNQKKNLQLVFRERQAQIKNQYQVKLQRLQRQRHLPCEEREKLKAEAQMLREQLDEPEDKENRYVRYQKQLATMDLQIALTQNLLTVLNSTTARQNKHHKTELDILSEGLSEKMSSDHSVQLRQFVAEQPQTTNQGEASADLRATFSFTPQNLFKQQ